MKNLQRSISGNGKMAGFTVIEIMLAILIVGIVLSSLYGALTGTLRMAHQGEYADRIYAMARGTMKQMMEDLESLAPAGGSFMFVGLPQNSWDPPLTGLRFLSSRRLDVGGGEARGGLQEISWFGRDDREQKSRFLVRRETFFQDRPDEWNEGPRDFEGGYIVAGEIQSLRCEFFDHRGEEHRTWDSRSDDPMQKGRAPSTISIHLEFYNPDNPEQPWCFNTRVFVPLADSVNHTTWREGVQ